MEQISELGIIRDDEEMEMPPGFRFHPTDEELISHYLAPKVLESNFTTRAIGEVDLNKVEPWDLRRRAKNIEESEWYFFCVRGRKYPTGLRTNRATKAGYWKATGKDKEIYKSKTLVGMKKTLVFYQGRAPKGEKTDWVIHEYRLEGKSSPYNLPRTAKIEWVISKVFHKSTGGKKILISGLDNQQDELEFSNLPTLTDWSSQDHHTKTVISTSQVTCFSDHSENKKTHENIFSNLNNSLAVSKHSEISPVSSFSDSFFSTHCYPNIENFPCPDSAVTQDQFFRKIFLQNNNFNMNKNFKMEFSPDTGINTEISSLLSSHEMGQGCYDDRENGITSIGLVDFDWFWNY